MNYVYIFTVFLLIGNQLHSSDPGSFQQVAGSPFPTASGPMRVVFSPITLDNNLYAAVLNLNLVSSYRVNQTTGELTPVPNSPYNADHNYGISYSPIVSGNLYAAVTLATHNVSVYSVNQTTGEFTEIINSPFGAGNDPRNIAYSPVVSGNLFAAVANFGDDTISIYLVDQATGAFSPIDGSPFAVDGSPYNLEYSPVVSGNLFLAVAKSGTDSVSVYLVNQTTGALTLVDSLPLDIPTFYGGIAYSPVVSGNLFFVVMDGFTAYISVYSVDQMTGALTLVEDSTFEIDFPASYITYSPVVFGNLFAAFTNYNFGSVFAYSVNTTNGVFSPVSGPPFPPGSSLEGIAYSPLTASGNLFALVANISDVNLSMFAVAFTLPTPTLLTAIANSSQLKVTGTGAQANATINVYVNDRLKGSGTADELGNFNFSINTKLIPGTYRITVKQVVGISGSKQSNSIKIIIHEPSIPRSDSAVNNGAILFGFYLLYALLVLI